MPRQARINVPGLFHHVMARGIEGREIFRDESDRENFLARLSDVLSTADAPRLYAWAWKGIGASLTALGKMTGRTHVAVTKVIRQKAAGSG